MTLQTSQIKVNDSSFDLALISKVSNIDATVLKNFRRPKLPPSHYGASDSIEPDLSATHGLDDLQTSGYSTYSIKPSVPTKLEVPVFSKRKIRDGQIPAALKANGDLKSGKENFKICMERGQSLSKMPQGTNSKSIAADTAVILPKQKRVCAEQEKNPDKKLQNWETKSITGEGLERYVLLKKTKAPDCSQQSRLSTASIDTPHLITESSMYIKQPPQDESSLTKRSINHQEKLSTSKTKDHNAQKVATATGEKKSARGEKKTIDSKTNQKKVLSKHAAGKLKDLTVPELKVFLSENKAKISGKKEELIQRAILLLSSLKPP